MINATEKALAASIRLLGCLLPDLQAKSLQMKVVYLHALVMTSALSFKLFDRVFVCLCLIVTRSNDKGTIVAISSIIVLKDTANAKRRNPKSFRQRHNSSREDRRRSFNNEGGSVGGSSSKINRRDSRGGRSIPRSGVHIRRGVVGGGGTGGGGS